MYSAPGLFCVTWAGPEKKKLLAHIARPRAFHNNITLSRKYWRSLNLAVWAFGGLKFGGMVQYRHMYMYAGNFADFNFAI